MDHLYKEQRSEGVVLKSVVYNDYDRIITVFTAEAGMVSLMVKKAHRYPLLTSPFCRAEFVYVKGKTDLHKFYDGTVLEDHTGLRTSLEKLSAAGEMVHAILHSQLGGKPAPKLYALLTTCMHQLATFDPPFRLTTSFRLKLLTHEGLISWEEFSLFPIPVIRSEWELLKASAQARSFQKIREIEISRELSLKIQNRFKEIV